MTFQRNASAGERFGFAPKDTNKIGHDARIAATMTAVGIFNRDLFDFAAMMMDGDLGGAPGTGAQRGTRAVIAHRAVFLVGMTVHHHCH